MIRLAQTPTPLQPLVRTSERLGVEVWVKRDDLTGAGLGGNKVRKLEYLLADALARGCRRVVTCGGVHSNHARATVVAARQLGLQPALLLRGTEPDTPTGNLLIDQLSGAEIHYVDPAGYADRAERLRALAGPDGYVIDEGGSNGLGALGFVSARAELARQTDALGVAFDSLVVAVGSGGTLAGLAAAPTATRVVGVPVCDDAPTFDRILARIGGELSALGHTLGPYELVEGFQGPGYGLTTSPQIDAMARLAREEGVLLDPTYTGKAWHALEALAAEGRLGRRTCFWHTGGLFGWFGQGELLEGLRPES